MKIPVVQKEKKLGLAFGGGGARGFTHVGVLKALTDHGIGIHYIAGTSAGAIAGAFYAGGISVDQMVKICKQLTWRNFARFHLSRKGMLSSKPILEFIEKYLGQKTFKDLTIPFSALATNILSGKGEELNHPNLKVSTAIRASASFPGVFPPTVINGHHYFDGGASYNLPCEVVRNMGADVVLGIDVIPQVELKVMPHNIPGLVDRGLDILLRNKSINLQDNGDLILTPIHERVSSFNVKRASHLIDLGIKSVNENIDQIKALLS